jgi:hypothetical protein
MGMTAGLWLVPAEEFAGVGRPRLHSDGPWFDLDKAWREFDQVFRDLPPPLNRAIGGDIRPEEEDPADATSLSFVSPSIVTQIARALDRIEPADMVGRIAERAERALGESDRRYFADYYEQLREAYRAAAATGAGLGVLLC